MLFSNLGVLGFFSWFVFCLDASTDFGMTH